MSSPLRQVLITRADRPLRKNRTSELKPLAELLVTDRIDAELIRHEVLRLMRPWRIRISRTRLPSGYTQAWLAGSPLIPLEGVANALQLDRYDIIATPRGAPSSEEPS